MSSSNSRLPSRRALICIAAVLMFTATACGGSPSEDADQPAATGAEDSAAAPASEPAAATQADASAAAGVGDCSYDEVFAEVDGLEGEERTNRLVELAREEGALNVYTSSTDLVDQAALFTEAYDVEVSVYRALANQLLQRLVQENEAGYAGADVFDTNSKEMAAANMEGLLQDYEGPVTDGLVDAAVQDGWVANRMTVFTVSWNTDLVQDPPTSYEDLADPRFAGQIMMEPREFDWYMALSSYLTENGMAEAEAKDLVQRIAANATQVTGNVVHANFLASGEFGLSTSVYSHLVDELIATGAPIARAPAVEPVLMVPVGPGLVCTAQNPAAATLFIEWMLTDAQELLLEDFRVPTRESMQGDDLRDVETFAVDVPKLVAERTTWEQGYIEVLANAQAEPAG